MDPATLAVLGGIAGAQTLGGIFSSQAAAEEAERQRKLQGTLSALQSQQQGMQGGIGDQQQALERILQNMRMGVR